MIEIDGTALHQWDVGRRVVVTGIEVENVHFANKGDSKAVVVGAVDIHAQIPDFLLQTGKQLCVYAVKDGITVESKTFYVKHRERPENYVYEDDHRNYIYELITSAEKAIEEANLAAKNANEAADNASGLAFIGFAEGNSIHLDDAASQFLVGLRVCGKTTQDGTPTPDAPVDLVSVVNPTVTVNDQTLLIPYTLHGIPVTSGGNYTDANGQQWICDEIDFSRGVYVQRVGTVVFDGSTDEKWNYSTSYINAPNDATLYARVFVELTAVGFATNAAVMCDKLGVYGQKNVKYNPINGQEIWASAENLHVLPGKDFLASENNIDSMREWLAQNHITVIYERGTPIETPLSEEELAAYAALRTYRNSTTVSNDASAHMEIEYAMNAKKYIESIIANHAVPTRTAYINLPASKWTGSDNKYSQVVSIAGITENSRVDLILSVDLVYTFYDKDVTFVAENDGGVVTVYAIGQKPQNDYTIKAEIEEVVE